MYILGIDLAPLVAIVVLLCGLLVANSVFMVSQSKVYVIERLGKYHRACQAGLHIKVPFIDRIANKVSLKEQVLDFPPQPMITHDNVTVNIDSVVFCKVFNPELFSYGVEDPIDGLMNLTSTTLRNIVGEMELDQLLTSREAINRKLETILDEATDPWGLKVTRVEIKQLILSNDLTEVMSSQMRAERERRQTVLEAQAHQEAVVSRATGDKKAKILAAEAEKEAKILAAEAFKQTQIAEAEGRAEAIKKVYQAEAEGIEMLNKAEMSQSVLKLKALDALKKVADGEATKIYMPTDLLSVIAKFGLVSDAMELEKKGVDEN